MQMNYSSRLVRLTVDNYYHDRALILFTMANILPYKAKRVYFSDDLGCTGSRIPSCLLLNQIQDICLRKICHQFRCHHRELWQEALYMMFMMQYGRK